MWKNALGAHSTAVVIAAANATGGKSGSRR
jgi:hypothetical protein